MATRRDSLALSGSALAASLSGCLSSGLLAGGPPEVREESGDPPARLSPAFPDLHADSTLVTLAVGDGASQDEQVWLWNETDRSLEVAVEIGGEAEAEPWFQQSYDLNADANLAIDLRESRDYAIAVGVGDRTETVEYPESWFDCNDTATDVVLRAEKFDVASIKTDQGCNEGFW